MTDSDDLQENLTFLQDIRKTILSYKNNVSCLLDVFNRLDDSYRGAPLTSGVQIINMVDEAIRDVKRVRDGKSKSITVGTEETLKLKAVTDFITNIIGDETFVARMEEMRSLMKSNKNKILPYVWFINFAKIAFANAIKQQFDEISNRRALTYGLYFVDNNSDFTILVAGKKYTPVSFSDDSDSELMRDTISNMYEWYSKMSIDECDIENVQCSKKVTFSGKLAKPTTIMQAPVKEIKRPALKTVSSPTTVPAMVAPATPDQTR